MTLETANTEDSTEINHRIVTNTETFPNSFMMCDQSFGRLGQTTLQHWHCVLDFFVISKIFTTFINHLNNLNQYLWHFSEWMLYFNVSHGHDNDSE